MRIVAIPSFELAAYLRGNPDAEKLALVLPGKLDTKDYPHMRSHVDYLANKGYLALSFDPPGTWESPGGIELYTMTNYLKAINELIGHFGNRPTVLMGHSRGGSMAMLAGTRNGHVTHIIAVMSSPGPGKVSEQAKKEEFAISYRDTPSGDEREFVVPLNYFEDEARYNMLDALSTCAKPKLYISGTRDDVITPASIRETYERSAAPKQLYEIDADHDYRFHPDKIDEINNVVGAFLEEN